MGDYGEKTEWKSQCKTRFRNNRRKKDIFGDGVPRAVVLGFLLLSIEIIELLRNIAENTQQSTFVVNLNISCSNVIFKLWTIINSK